MAADKSPSRFARLREALAYRLPLLYVALLVAVAVLFFWVTVAWSGQRLRLFLLSLITLFAIVLLVWSWQLFVVLKSDNDKLRRKAKGNLRARKVKKKLRKKAEEQIQFPYVKSAPPEPADRALFRRVEALPQAAEAPSDFVLGSEPEFAIVRVFYATDRQSTEQDSPSRFYGKEQSSDGKLSMGTCEVSIPRDHRIAQSSGQIQRGRRSR